MNNNEKQALHDRLVQAFEDCRKLNESDTCGRGISVRIVSEQNEHIVYIPVWSSECMDTEAAARSDKDVDLTEYDQAVEVAETIYDEPDFYEWLTDRYPGKIAEYDEAAAQMMIEAFSESRAWDLVNEAIAYTEGNL